MKARRDAGLAAAETALAAERIARELGGVATTGVLQLHPGAATVIPGVAELTVDLRHSEADSLAAMLRAARSAAQHDAAARGCDVSAERIWAIEPIEFDAGLVELAREACVEVAGTDRVLVSGALHDAAEIARRRPAAMLFVRSLGGISHSPQEDSSEEDLSLAIRAYAELAERAMSRA